MSMLNVAKVLESWPNPRESAGQFPALLEARPGTSPFALGRILVPVDFSDVSLTVVRFAWSLAQAVGGHMTLLYVYPERPSSRLSPSDSGVAIPDKDLHLAARRRLLRLVASVAGQASASSVEVRAGDPGQEILRAAAAMEADLLVISWHGFGGLRRLAHSSLASRLLQGAPCPVLQFNQRSLVRASEEAAVLPLVPRRITVAWEPDGASPAVVAYAAKFAGLLGATLDVVNCPTDRRPFRAVSDISAELAGKAADAIQSSGVPKAREGSETPADQPVSDLRVVELSRGPGLNSGGGAQARKLMRRVRGHILGVPRARWSQFSVLGSSNRWRRDHACAVDDGPVAEDSGKGCRFARVLVATDLRGPALDAIEHACRITGGGGTVRLLYVAHPDELPQGQFVQGFPSPDSVQAHKRHLRCCWRELSSLVPRDAAERGVRFEVAITEHRDPAMGICEAAEKFGAELVCLSDSSQPAPLRMLFGTLPKKVQARCKKPVLIVERAE